MIGMRSVDTDEPYSVPEMAEVDTSGFSGSEVHTDLVRWPQPHSAEDSHFALYVRSVSVKYLI